MNKTKRHLGEDQPLTTLKDGLEGEVTMDDYSFLKEMENGESFSEHQKELRREHVKVVQDIDLLERALADLKDKKSELENQLI